MNKPHLTRNPLMCLQSNYLRKGAVVERSKHPMRLGLSIAVMLAILVSGPANAQDNGQEALLEDVSTTMSTLGHAAGIASACGISASRMTGAATLYAAIIQLAQDVSVSPFNSAEIKRKYTKPFFEAGYQDGQQRAVKSFKVTSASCKAEDRMWPTIDQSYKLDTEHIVSAAGQIRDGSKIESPRLQKLQKYAKFGYSVQAMRLCGVVDSQMQGFTALYGRQKALLARSKANTADDFEPMFRHGVDLANQKGKPPATVCSKVEQTIASLDSAAATAAHIMADYPAE